MMLSAVGETFANCKLRNYKSDVNKTYMTYVSTFHFQKNEGVNERVTDGISKYLP